MSKETDSLQTAMRQASQLAEVISKIDEIVELLAEKRVTLEEKMIRAYLHDLASVAGRTASAIHLLTKGGAWQHEEVLSRLEPLSAEILSSLAELLKITRYDLNFLEQYYEHDFYDNLVAKHYYLERLGEIEKNLSARLKADQTGQ